MNSPHRIKYILLLSLLIIAVFVFVSSISSLINMDGTSQFTVREQTTFTITKDTTYYFMKDNYHEDDVYRGTNRFYYTEIQLESDTMSVWIVNLDTYEYYIIDVIDQNTSIQINGFDVIGTVELEPGEYEITFADIDGSNILISNFKLTETGMIGDILLLFTSIFGVIIVTVLLSIVWSKARRIRRRKTEEELWHYQEPSNVDLFDVEDPFEDYSENKRR